MKFSKISLKDAYVIKPEPFEDNRGRFSRLFCQKEFQSIGLGKEIVQVNHSVTIQKGSIRGMHFQQPPMAETKIVKCLYGAIFDVIIDMRKHSATFLKWHGEVLSGENMKMIYVPEGFAHGFQCLEQNSEIVYLVTQFYSPIHEKGVRYDDPAIGISWPLEVTDVSKKDREYRLLDSNSCLVRLQ